MLSRSSHLGTALELITGTERKRDGNNCAIVTAAKSPFGYPIPHVPTLPSTEVPAYSDTLGTWEKCHCNQIVTVTRGSVVLNQAFGTAKSLNSVTVSGEICINFVFAKVLLLCDEEERGDLVQAVGLGPDAEGPHHLPHCLLRPQRSC